VGGDERLREFAQIQLQQPCYSVQVGFVLQLRIAEDIKGQFVLFHPLFAASHAQYTFKVQCLVTQEIYTLLDDEG